MAQKGINKQTILGNLGNTPEIRYTATGDCVANLSIATSDYWKDKATGDTRESTEWHRVVVFGKLAEVVRDRAQKGSQLYIEGKSKTRKYQDDNGQTQYIKECVVEGYQGVLQILSGHKVQGDAS